MKLSGTTTAPAGRVDLWGALSDPGRLGEALPGVDGVEIQDDQRFSATVLPVTGLGATPIAIAFELAEIREPEHVRIDASGAGGEYAVEFSVELDLADGGGSTDVRWSADVAVRGVLGSVAQRVAPMVAREQIELVLATAASMSSATTA